MDEIGLSDTCGSVIIGTLPSESASLRDDLADFLSCLTNSFLPYWQNKLDSTYQFSHFEFHASPERHTGVPGRPRLLVDHDQIVCLRDMGFNWSEIARLLGISRMTLYRRRMELGITGSCYTDISYHELCSVITEIREQMPDVGERMLNGALVARGILIKRQQLRDAIHDVDPVNTALRWNPRLLRQPYSVPGPNSLWHLGRLHETVCGQV